MVYGSLVNTGSAVNIEVQSMVKFRVPNRTVWNFAPFNRGHGECRLS